MRINIHAGHNADGQIACGAIGFIRESTEARRVKDAIISQLRQLGHTVYDCTVDNASGVSANLSQIVTMCNAHEVDLDISIHFNAGAKDAIGNGETTGVEAYIYKDTSGAKEYAKRVCDAVAGLGFRSRGIKINNKLYVLKNTSAPAMLIECCFVDDKDDVQMYDYQQMAEAIVYGITGQRVQVEKPDSEKDPIEPGAETTVGDKDLKYQIRLGTYTVKKYAEAKLAEAKAKGLDAIMVRL